MFKRIIVRVLVFLQLYSSLFQGIAHANIMQGYHVEDEIYLHSTLSKDGAMRLAIGTNRGSEQQLLDVIEVPAYQTFTTNLANQPPEVEVVNPSQDNDYIFKRGHITRDYEGSHFTLQGLTIFISNDGEILVAGRQTDFSKPIFLSSQKSIVLHDVEASALKLISPAIVSIGHANIDFLSLEGSGSTPTFLNRGVLTAKELFLKNLHTTNAGSIAINEMETQTGVFNNTGNLDIDTELVLGNDKFVNSGRIDAHAIHALESLTTFENTAQGKIFLEDTFKDKGLTTIINNGTIEGGDYQFNGPTLQQNGKLFGRSLKTGKNTQIITHSAQEISLEDSLEMTSTLPWSLKGKVKTKAFNSIGSLNLEGVLDTTSFKGHGAIQASGKLNSEKTWLIKDCINAGEIDTQLLQADAKLSNQGYLLSRHTTEILDSLVIGKNAVAKLHALKLNGLTIENSGELKINGTVDMGNLKLINSGLAEIDGQQRLTSAQGQDPQNLLKMMHSATPENPVPVNAHIKLNVLNQQQGHLTLKAAVFEFSDNNDNNDNQNSINNGTLVQDHAYLQWMQFPNCFNQGLWQVKGALNLLGYAGQPLGKLKLDDVLHVSAAGDSCEILKGLKNTQSVKLIMQAPSLTIKEDRQLAMPLELRIQDNLNVQAKLLAPAIEIYAKSLELGTAQGKWGVLSAYQEDMKIYVDSFANRFGHLTAMKNTSIEVNGDEFINGAYVEVANHIETGATVIGYPRKRNGAAISTGGDLEILLKGPNAFLNNYYGLLQSDGHLRLRSQKAINNLAGIISSKGGGLLSALDIAVHRDEISTKASGGKFCDGHYYAKKGRQVRDSCSGGGYCTQAFYSREQSDTGWINIGGGDLVIETDVLTVIASHITSKDRLFLKSQNIEVPKGCDGQMSGVKGVLVQSHQDKLTYSGMTPRAEALLGIHKAGIYAYGDMKFETNGLKIEGISDDHTVDALKALVKTLQTSGFNVTNDEARDLLIDITSSAHSQASEPHSMMVQQAGQICYDLPFEKKKNPTYGRGPLPILISNYQEFDRILRPNIRLQHTVSKRVLEDLLDGLVIKILHQAQSNDFSRRLYENSQQFAITNMQKRLLQSKEVTTEKQALEIINTKYQQLIPISHEDMRAYKQDMQAYAKKMIMFDIQANYRTIEQLKRMEEDLDQETYHLRPTVFLPQEAIAVETTTAAINTEKRLDSNINGNMDLSGAAKYRGHGGTTTVAGDLNIKAVAVRQGNADNYQKRGAHPEICNAGNDNTQNFIVDGNINQLGGVIDTGGKDNVMNLQARNVINEALLLDSLQTSEHYGKKSYTRTSIHEVIPEPTIVGGLGDCNINTGVIALQAPIIKDEVKLNIRVDALELSEAHASRVVESQTQTQKSGKLGKSSKKSVTTSMRNWFSKGGKIGGLSFVTRVQQFSATNTIFDAPQVDITATVQADLKAGTSTSFSHQQTVYNGAIWNKVSSTAEQSQTHQPCTITQPITVDTPSLSIERKAGSGAVSNIITPHPIQYIDKTDQHHATSKSQKSLSVGAALITKLAVSLALWNPVTFGLSGTQAVMANAGFGALCGDAATSLIENDGNPARAIHAMSKNGGAAMNVARAMLTAGLVKEFGDAIGIKSGFGIGEDGKLIERTLNDYAKQAVVQSAVNTALAVAIDGKDLQGALSQGVSAAALNTVAAWGAGQISNLYSAEALNYGAHKALHGLLGAGLGTGMAAIANTDPRVGAVSGLFGAVVSEMIADGFKPEKLDVIQHCKDHPDQDPNQVQAHFIEKAQTTANWSAFASAVGALGVGLDPLAAHTVGRNAVDNNSVQCVAILVCGGILMACPQYWRDLETDEPHVALGKMGIEVVKDTAMGAMVGAIAFEVGGIVYKSLKEAIAKAVANNPMLQNMATATESWMLRVERYVRDQFNYQEHFAAERQRIAEMALEKPAKFGKYAEAEDLLGKHGKISLSRTENMVEDRAGLNLELKNHPLFRGKILPEHQLQGPDALGHIPYAGGYQRSFVTTQDEIYYRVYSGDSTVGSFLTKIKPQSSALAKEGLALPSSNNANFIQEVIVPAGVRLQRSRALAGTFGKRGGMEQFQFIVKKGTDLRTVATFKPGVPLS